MSTRLYVGNLPQNFDQKELEGMFAAVGAGVRFKAVLDRDTGVCRGFGFVNLDEYGRSYTVQQSTAMVNFTFTFFRALLARIWIFTQPLRQSTPLIGPGFLGNEVLGDTRIARFNRIEQLI